MSQELQRLHLSGATAAVELGYRTYKERDGIVRDLQAIHDPLKTWRQRWRERYLTLGDIALTAQPQAKSRAMFGAEISVPTLKEGMLHVRLDRPSDPRQAAGWAALQFYNAILTGKPGVKQLHAIDPLAGIAAKVKARDYNDVIGSEVWTCMTGLPSSVPLPGKEVVFWDIPEDEGGGTHMAAFNDGGRYSLPDLLQLIKKEYDYCYPGANTSEAVAGIVGAISVEAFRGAWEAAVPKGAVDGARSLLESEAFRANPNDTV